MIVAFRLVLWLTAASFFIPAGLIAASLFLAGRAPHSATFVNVSVAVSLFFLAAGILMLGIQSRIVAIARLNHGRQGEARSGVDRHLIFLMAYLMLGGMALCMIMAIVTFAIVMRLNEGNAIFG